MDPLRTRNGSHKRLDNKKQQDSVIKQQVAMSPKTYNQQKSLNTSFDTPCRQIAQLELKPKFKQGKLLSSKSLSQLMPRKLFFKRPSWLRPADSNELDTTVGRQIGQRLATTRSFPNKAFDYDSIDEMRESEPVANRVNSISLIGLPRQSTSSALKVGDLMGDVSPIERPHLSPIVQANVRGIETLPSDIDEEQGDVQPADVGHSSKTDEDQQKAGKRSRPFKNTALVLRDVKNSIGLRIKAKQESRAFAKLTNELATPPTKLYSPFNIYATPQQVTACTPRETKSRRRLNLINGHQQGFKLAKGAQGGDQQVTQTGASSSQTTPKNRVALQHKKHLMQANKFSFDSPTGRLRETVKEVEQMQLCIEDISKAIKERNHTKS